MGNIVPYSASPPTQPPSMSKRSRSVIPRTAPEELLDAGDSVVGLGNYTGTYKATGREVRAQFAHVWGLREGKVVSFQQYTDTKQFAAAVA